jgi:uncharacterized repeat protein (TIGR03803 family)
MSCTIVRNLTRASRKSWKVSAAIAVFVLLAVAISSAQATFTNLFDFDGTDGEIPYYVSLVQGTDGQLYGTAANGGGKGLGTAYKITTAGTFTQLYSFCSQAGCADGGLPYAGLVMAANGNFYGTTTCDNGCTSAPLDGTIFEITPSGTYSVLHTFVGTDGSGPYSNMVLGSDGNLYGTTLYGGNLSICEGLGCGTVFKVTLPVKGTPKFTSLYSFQGGSDGYNPFGRLVQGSNGNYYGTTAYGGNYTFTGSGGGTVFEITPTGKLTTLYSFCSLSGCPDGGGPYGGVVQTSNGTIYGTTAGGGANAYGTLFKLVGKKLTTLYNFCQLTNCADGNYPYGGLIQATDGNFYGTTGSGGPSAGTVLMITPQGALTTLYSFCSQPGCADGSGPYGDLLQATDGNFYGTTFQGGVSGALGTIFSISNGLGPFVQSITSSGKVGAAVTILGMNLTGTTAVNFGAAPATFTVNSTGTAITTSVPAGATTGLINVVTPSGTLASNATFKVAPQIKTFTPSSGPVGTVVTITGVSLTQTTKVTFGGVKATSFTVNSDTQVSATVPSGAKTGKLVITTPGGTASSATNFTVM